MENYEYDSFDYIDGYNLDEKDLKNRLIKMGLENNLPFLHDAAKVYNDIINSRDYDLIAKIKSFLDKDFERPDFSNLLHKKRIRESLTSYNLSNGFTHYPIAINELNYSENKQIRYFNF